MKLKDFLRISNTPPKSFDIIDQSVFNIRDGIIDHGIKTNNGTIFDREAGWLGRNRDYSLLILTEPKSSSLLKEELEYFMEDYINCLKEAQLYGVPVLHLVTNIKWYTLFQDTIIDNKLDVYISKSDDILMRELRRTENVLVTEDYLMPSNLIHYTNEINGNIILDLTGAVSDGKDYALDIDRLIENSLQFDNVTLLLPEGSYLPPIKNSKVEIIYLNKERAFDFRKLLSRHTYVYIYSNTPYKEDMIQRTLFYAANSMVVFTNYNYMINNILPSVILNLNNKGYSFAPLEKKDAFDVLNENRNAVMYNYTFINILSNMFRNYSLKLVHKLEIPSSIPNGANNNYFDIVHGRGETVEAEIKDVKYDIEQTLLFPILFLGKGQVNYMDSHIHFSHHGGQLNMPDYRFEKTGMSSRKSLSIIVPIHNNGKYLKYKCYLSMKMLTCFDELEIIFVDDGSSDDETLRIVEDILRENEEIVYRRFDEGSGSASRPRNAGMELASTELVTFLDPDNEAIADGFSVLLNEMKDNPGLDMVIGNIVREDNVKRNEIRYYNKVVRAFSRSEISDTRQLLIQTDLTVQSIQALVVKKHILVDNGLRMVEGAAGQDTLFFQELLLSCDTIKVVDHMIHSYYAYVEGSVTNTVTHRFFEKFYKVELERIKFLERENLMNEYMEVKFDFYFTNWYLKKYRQISTESEKEKAKAYLLKILELYEKYTQPYEVQRIRRAL